MAQRKTIQNIHNNKRKDSIRGYLCMTRREFRDFLQDILEAIYQLEKITQKITFIVSIIEDLTENE